MYASIPHSRNYQVLEAILEGGEGGVGPPSRSADSSNGAGFLAALQIDRAIAWRLTGSKPTPRSFLTESAAGSVWTHSGPPFPVEGPILTSHLLPMPENSSDSRHMYLSPPRSREVASHFPTNDSSLYLSTSSRPNKYLMNHPCSRVCTMPRRSWLDLELEIP
jgi:hypothetical protein